MRNFYSLKKHFLSILLLLFLVRIGVSQTTYISKEEYRDKTLAMIIGSIGGLLTGYEFLHEYNTPNGFYQPGATRVEPQVPLLCLPDDWFILMNGTLGGTTKDEYNYAPWIMGPGRINSDDDNHIDFFNQWLLNEYGLSITYEDIKHEWLDKEVSDFGGGQGAIEVMRDKDLMAPQCGHRDHGNSGHWLPECYIEHEMMGGAFPGMPNKAAEFAEKFSHIIGEGENVTWGYYWAAAHAIAYFEQDSRTAIEKAVGMMPGNSRPRQMYEICKSLKQKYPNDWRPAVRELWKDHWTAPFAVEYAKVMEVADVNNGTAFLSILYGNNDYLEVIKIASLAGGDGDCTASAVGGIMGIIKGMAGTPQKFKDDIWAHGNGVWINDVVHAFSIKKDWQIEWKYDELVDMFQQNAEMVIRAYGGKVTGTGYEIQMQSGNIPQITSTNWDFESGNLDGWKTWKAGGGSSIWNERQCNDYTQACYAATGHYKGTILTHSNTAEAKLYQTITGLTPGATYKIEGRIHTAGGRPARLYVDHYGGPYKYASMIKGNTPFSYMYLYVTMGENNTTLDVGLHAPPTESEGKWCSIDDIIIKETENPSEVVRYEAENATTINNAIEANSNTASGSSYVAWINKPDSYLEFENVMAAYEGEYIIRINYANNGAFSTQKIFVNDRYVGLIEHADTGPWGQFSANVTDAYVKLEEGANTIKIGTNSASVEIDYIELLSPYGSEGKPADDGNLIDGGIYKIVARHSGKVLDLNGEPANGARLIQNSFTGAPTQYFKLIKDGGVYHIAPINNEQQSVEVVSSNMNNEAAIGLWGYWGGATQKWAIIDADPGYFKVINHNSGKVMDVAGVSQADGANVFQYDYLSGHNQQWRFDFVGMSKDNFPHIIPGKFEAEFFSTQIGTGTENTTDAGGGVNVMDIDIGEFLEYQIYVEKTGEYNLGFRVASATTGGTMSVKSDGAQLADYTIAGTGGWQNWTTISKQVNLEEGLHTLRLDFGGTEADLFNLNWIEATPVKDCYGTDFGTAYTDVCGECVGGETGKITTDADEDGIADCEDNDMDNDGVTSDIDCNDDVPEIKGPKTWYADGDGDGIGSEGTTQSSCIQPEYYVAIFGDECPEDGNKTEEGNCGCGNTEESCIDCAGTPNGDAFYDNCNQCVLNVEQACTQDCAGEWGGEAFEDACEICAGGNTGIEPQEECVATGVDSDLPKGILIYPNPFNKLLHVAVDDAYIIQITTTDGKLLMEKAIENSTEFTLDYPAGVYVLKAFNQEYSFIQLITKY